MAHGIVVRVFNTTDQSVADHTFRRLPVRIGRNPLNDLVLENPVVSQFHAVLEQHGQALFLRDLGSTNGTTLRASGRVPPNQVVNLGDHQYEFAIVSLLMRVWSVQISEASPPQPAGGRKQLGVTSMFSAASAQSGPANQQVASVMMRLAGHYTSYRSGWSQFMKAIQSGTNELPPDARAALLEQIAKDYPHASQEPEFRTFAGQNSARIGGSQSLSADSVAFQGLRELAQDFVPDVPPPTTPQEAAAFAAKLQSTIDVFLRSFIPLRDGYQQLEKDLIGGAPSPVTDAQRASVRAAKDPKELARLLLDWRGASNDSFAEVESTFADLMIHQVAMLSGVMQGVRTLLGKLSPKLIEQEAAGASAMQKYKALWRAFEERYKDFTEETQIHKYVFGSLPKAMREARGEADDRHTHAQQAVWPRK